MKKRKRYGGLETIRVSYSLDIHTIEMINKKSGQLGLSRSLYIRKLVEKDNKIRR